METLKLVKSKIEKLDRKINTYNEIEDACPVIKRQNINGKMENILQNPETKNYVIISNDEVEELNELYHIAKYGVSTKNDPFLFN